MGQAHPGSCARGYPEQATWLASVFGAVDTSEVAASAARCGQSGPSQDVARKRDRDGRGGGIKIAAPRNTGSSIDIDTDDWIVAV